MGDRTAEHVFQPMGTGVLSRDQKATDITELIKKEIADIDAPVSKKQRNLSPQKIFIAPIKGHYFFQKGGHHDHKQMVIHAASGVKNRRF